MLRRFNYTNRKRINHDDVSFVLRDGNSDPFFDADLSLLTTYGLEKECRVFVEAYRQTIWIRFDFGLVGAIQPPSERSLVRFGSADGIHFRVKVTDPSSSHRLVAETDALPFRQSRNAPVPVESLLRIIPASMEFEIYRLAYDEDGPILELNKDVGDKIEIAKDPAFGALVYTAVFKDILTRILLVEKHDDMESAGSWQSQWLRFAMNLKGVVALPDIDALDDLDDWIGDAVGAFAAQTNVKQKFGKHREGRE